MKAHEVYRQIREKAEEVKEAIHAILSIRGDKSRWTADDLIDLLSRDSGLLVVEADIERDNRRHVKVLYKDYCALRNELTALLTAETMPSKPRVELELPEDDHRDARVCWSEMEGDTLHVCIAVTDRAP